MLVTVGHAGRYVYCTVTVDAAVEAALVSRLPLGALAVALAVASIVNVIAVRLAELVKNARLDTSVNVVVAVSVTTSGGKTTVSVPEPNGPAGVGALVSICVGCVMG